MTATPFGFAHFLSQADDVARCLLALLLAMSVGSWYLILAKGMSGWIRRRRSRRFLDSFRAAASLQQVADQVGAVGGDEPFSHLAAQALAARAQHRRSTGARIPDASGTAEFVSRRLRSAIDEETADLESGLTALATVGATAPFVGLFGTVWGVYHALLAVGASGSGTLDKVAGPVGEALLMTGLGLAVALPAVTGYNFLVRGNRVLLARLDAFAHELFAHLATGEPVHADGVGPAPAVLTRPAAAGA